MKYVWRLWPLTKLASLLDERDRLKAANETLMELKVTGFDVSKHGEWAASLSHDVLPIIAQALAVQFEQQGATNYLEAGVDITSRVSLRLGEYTVTLQRRGRPTPHEFRVRAEEALRELWLSIVELPDLRFVTPRVGAAIRTASLVAGDDEAVRLHRLRRSIDAAMGACYRRQVESTSAGSRQLYNAILQLRHAYQSEHETFA